MADGPSGFYGDAPAADPGGGSTDSGSDDDSDLGGTAPNNGGTSGGGRGPRFDDDPVDGGGDPAPDPDPDPSPGPSTGGGSPSFPGGSDPGPAPEPDPVQSRVDAVTSGVTDAVSRGIDAGQDVVSDVSGGVDRVEDTLPGATGTAFAAGAGLAAVPEPTPVTEVSGTAIAGGAALVGGGVLASRALRDSEIDVGERVTNELDVGDSRRDVTEIEPGAGRVSELEPGTTSPVPTEVGVGSTVASSEIDVPSDSGTGLDDTFGATGVQIGREEAVDDDATITRDDLVDDLPDVDQPAPSIRERQRREDLTAPEREFPTGESAVIGRETASEIADQTQEPSLEQPATAFGTGAGSRGIRDLFLAGDERPADDVAGAGTEPGSGLGTFDTATVTTEPDVPTDVGTDGETDLVGGGTGTGTQTDTATAATGETVVEPALLGETTVPAQETAEPDAQFAEPELTAFETQVADPTVPEVSTGPGRASRDIRDFRLPGDDDNDDPDVPGLGLRADQLDSGILSGDEALRNFLGR